jgi:hypothetical protein
MTERKFILTARIAITLFNEENFYVFGEEDKRKFLVQEMLDQSNWPGEGIGCEVIEVLKDEDNAPR